MAVSLGTKPLLQPAAKRNREESFRRSIIRETYLALSM